MYVKYLKKTCNHIASTFPGTNFVETKWGGYFQKGNRKLGAVVSNWQKDDTNASVRINKWKQGYGLNVHPKDVGMYSRLRESVKIGLGIKE